MGGLLEGDFLRLFSSEPVIPNAPHRSAILIHFDEDTDEISRISRAGAHLPKIRR